MTDDVLTLGSKTLRRDTLACLDRSAQFGFLSCCSASVANVCEVPFYATANFRTNIMDFRGFDSSIILIIRGGTLMSIGDFPEDLSQAMLVGIMLVGRLGVQCVTNMEKP